MILYSTGCPKCKILENKMIEKNVKFTKSDDLAKVYEVGYRSVPLLEVDNKILSFADAVVYINSL